MALSNDLISQFAKITKPEANDTPKESIVYGTAVEYSGKMYARLDGSDRLTPIITTTGIKAGDRVTVTIKNHSAIITGNITSPSAGKDDVDAVKDQVDEIGNQITEFEIVIADKVSTKEFDAQVGRIDELVSDNILVKGELEANSADIDKLKADNVTITGDLTAANAEIETLKTTKLDASIAEITYATITNLDAVNAYIHNLEADYGVFVDLTTETLAAIDAEIKNLDTEKLSAEDAKLIYANIDFANIGKAAIENFFSKSGMIGDLVVGDGTITGTLVGVTIKGDLIEGGTVKADKLVVQGSDGLYYKLNVTGETVAAEQTEYNSLSGSIITAKSITAEKVNVNDLVAFGATIGGFHITEDSLYSGVKETVDNTTRGIFMGDDGQFAVGDSSNFLKFYKDKDGTYKLAISASQLVLGSGSANVEDVMNDAITDSKDQFYSSTSPTELSGGTWTDSAPTWEEGKYIWRRTVIERGNGTTEYLPSSNGVCISGNTGPAGTPGEPGEDGIGILSSTVTYAVSESGTTIPNDGWTSDIPSVPEGNYLWTKTVLTYTDEREITSYSVGKMGQNGTDGDDGKGIQSNEITYTASNSGTIIPEEAEWTSTIPETTVEYPYLWTKTTLTYTDETTSTSYSVSSTMDSVEVGGRNLLLKSKEGAVGFSNPLKTWELAEAPIVGETYTFSMKGELDSTLEEFRIFLKGGITFLCSLESKKDGLFVGTFPWTNGTEAEPTGVDLYFYPLSELETINNKIEWAKLEKGNTATDWTPAPEDMATSDAVNNAQDTANMAQDTANAAGERVTVTEAAIKILQESIQTLVTDENGSSLMTQTGDGWTFNIGAIQNAINSASENINGLASEVTEHASVIDSVNSLANDIAEKTAYINMTTDDFGAPCIELGKSDNDFKLRITNTSIDFMDGSSKVTYISNQSLFIKNAVIEDELSFGTNNNWIWKNRTNGNLGLRWEGN